MTFHILIFDGSQGKFPLGQLVITTNAQRTLDPNDVHRALTRHASCDWGDLCLEDAALNEQALVWGGRLFSAYGTGPKKFWIITDADFATTTVLMPEDY